MRKVGTCRNPPNLLAMVRIDKMIWISSANFRLTQLGIHQPKLSPCLEGCSYICCSFIQKLCSLHLIRKVSLVVKLFAQHLQSQAEALAESCREVRPLKTQLMVELPIWKKNILPLTFVVKLEIILRGEELNIKNRWEKIPTGQPPNRITTIIHELEWLSEGCGKVLIANHLVSLLVAEPFDNSPSAQWESELFHWNCVEQVINYIPLYL